MQLHDALQSLIAAQVMFVAPGLLSAQGGEGGKAPRLTGVSTGKK